MEKAYLNINVPNLISVGIIAFVLYLGHMAIKKFVMKS